MPVYNGPVSTRVAILGATLLARLAIGLGPEVFDALLAGAAAMDEHFRTAALTANAPVLLALSHVFNRNGLGRPARSVVPGGRFATVDIVLVRENTEGLYSGVEHFIAQSYGAWPYIGTSGGGWP